MYEKVRDLGVWVGVYSTLNRSSIKKRVETLKNSGAIRLRFARFSQREAGKG